MDTALNAERNTYNRCEVPMFPTTKAQARGLRATLDLVRDAVICADVHGDILQMNLMAETLTGWSEQEAKGGPTARAFKTIDQETGLDLEDLVTRVLRGGSGAELSENILLIAKDGTLRPIFITNSGTQVLGEAGELIGVALVFHDQAEERATLQLSAERTEAGNALGVSERKYRRLFETAKDGILILDGDSGDVIDVNPFLLEVTGYGREDILGKQLWELGLFKDIAANKASFATLQAQQYVRHEDLPLQGRNGRKVDVEFVSNVYRVDGRRVIQCNIRDITDRKRAEAERQRLIAAIEQIAEMVLVTDEKASITYVNAAFEKVTGYSRGEVQGRNPSLLKSGAHDQSFYKNLWAILGEGKAFHGRMTNKTKNGTLYTEEATISPVSNAEGIVTSYVAVKRDVTQDLALAAQLLQSQKMEAVGQLAAGIAHDFNNLLVVIISFSQLLLDDLVEADPARADLEEIKKAGDRAAVLTRQLLAFSRQQVIELRPVNLNDVVTDMEKMLRRVLGEAIEIVTLETPDLGIVSADVGQMEQVLMNLAVNARDAMPRGGRLTIETANVVLDGAYAEGHVGVTQAGPHVVLSVSDTGFGMSKETLGHVFEPFFTTKEVGKGTGLGLSMVFGVVKQLNGNVTVYSEPGKGSTFKVYLPRSDEAYARKALTAQISRGGHETILLVDDEVAVRNAAQRILERGGYKVLVAQSASEALRLCRAESKRIDLLLSDIVMPGSSGPSLAELLQAMHPELRVLFMSGYSDEMISRRSSGSGAAFLQKPFSPDVLSRKVREALTASPGSEESTSPSEFVSPGMTRKSSGTSASPVLGTATLAEGDAQDSTQQVSSRTSSASARARVALSGRILVVDDTPEWLHVYTRILESVGYQVDVATDAVLASEKAKEGYDVVVTDIAMPGLDGIELLRRIHQFDPDVPVILITGHPEVESAMKAVDLGAFKYLCKPVASETLLTTVQEALRLHRTARLKGEALGLLHDLKIDIDNRPAKRGLRQTELDVSGPGHL